MTARNLLDDAHESVGAAPVRSQPPPDYALVVGVTDRSITEMEIAEFPRRSLRERLLRPISAVALFEALQCAPKWLQLGIVIHFGGADLPGVFVLRTAEDAHAIREYGTSASRAAVIGGGPLGLAVAKGSGLLKRQIERLGVHVHVHKQVSRIEAAPRTIGAGGASITLVGKGSRACEAKEASA